MSPLNYLPNAYGQSLLPKGEKIFEDEKPKEKPAVSQIEAELERARFIRYKQERWNEMRQKLETGETLVPILEKPVPVVERRVLPQPPPPGPGLNVVLPYESGLSISGRKVIDFKLSSTIYAQPDSGKGRIDKTDFSLDQQLQVRVKGTVGRKVTVNVDFDDTREDKRDISVVYKGDPDETLQEAAFGDISISLPSTEFVGYSKSVFGVRAELLFRPRTQFARLFPSALWHRYSPKSVRLFMIGSQTKGITQTKRFTGNYILQRKEINDISYPRRQFYQLAFSTAASNPTGPNDTFKKEHRPIQAGSERIFLDDQNPANNNIDESTRTFYVVPDGLLNGQPALTSGGGTGLSISTFTGPAGINTGVFKLLVPGIDYTVDYTKGTIRFKRVINQRDIIVADYKPVDDNRPLSQIISSNQDPLFDTIKSIQDTILFGYKPILIKPDESQFFATRELKNMYILGDTKIQRDDGRGNFNLKIIDLNRNDPTQIDNFDASTPTLALAPKGVPKYPNDIDMDFENGIITFVSSDVLRSPFVRPFSNDIYVFRENVPSFKNRYRIFAEYRFRKGNFSLDQTNIVSQSEQVFVDGKRMTRDVDYFIDYDAGLVTFFRPDSIRDDSVVEITYDYSPFGGSGNETLVGERSEWYVTDNFFIGQSLLLNFSPRSQTVPDLRSTSKKIMVLESDINWKNIKFGNFPIQITGISAEVAESIKNPNTADKATLETFEGVKVEDNANLNKDFWQVAANPLTGNPLGGAFSPGYAANAAGQNGIFLSNEDFKITDINPTAVVETSDRLQSLKLDYKLLPSGTGGDAASIVQVLNRAGVDMFSNRRQFAELWINGDNSNARIQMRLGGIQEKSDSDSGLSIKTEDRDNTATLSAGEDIGWTFLNPDLSTTTVGAGNGRLDSQDLDGNGRLDSDDTLGNYAQEIGTANNQLIEAVNGTPHQTVDWSGWKLFSVPLNITASDQNLWASIKQVRITVSNPSGVAKTGTLRFGRITIVGTRFEQAAVAPTINPVNAKAYAANNQDNPEYPSLVSNPAFQDLYDLQDTSLKRREQGLAIQYTSTGARVDETTVTVKEVFTRALDLSSHESIKFFVNGDGTTNKFIFRVGNSGNYLEFESPLTFTGWQMFTLDILDKNKDGKLDHGLGNWTRIVGNPSLRNITEITYGAAIPPGAADPTSHKIYFNEVHVAGAVQVVGVAYRAKSDFVWPNWGSWGLSWRNVDRNFETLTSVGSGVDSKSGNAYLTLSRMKFLPVSSNLSYAESVTPQIQSINDPNILVSVLSEGKSINTTQSLSGNLLLTQLPLIPNFIRGKLLNIDFSSDHSLAIHEVRDGRFSKRFLTPYFINSQQLLGSREDETFNYRFGTSYTIPWQPDILPSRFLTFKPLPTGVSFSFSQTNSYLRQNSDNTTNRSVGEDYSARSQFQFFPQLTLSPAYTYGHTYEERGILDTDVSKSTTSATILDSLGTYNKNTKWNASMAGSLRITSWLNPGFNYTINTDETNNVNAVLLGTDTVKRGQIKSISRSSSGDISASISPKDIFQYIRYVREINRMINSLSFSGGYSVSDGDTYENVPEGYDTTYKFLIRDHSLDVPTHVLGQDGREINTNARRMSLTASDTSRVSGRWTPFEGFTWLKNKRWGPIKNFNTSGTFTETKTNRDTTGTLSKSYSKVWPDFVFSTSEIEKPLFLSRWISDTRMNGNYQERLSETLGQTRSTGKSISSDVTFTAFKLLQFSLGYQNSTTQEENLQINQVTSRTRQFGFNGQVITTLKWGNWRFTPRYDQNQSEAEDGTGKKTSDLINRNGSLQVFGDINIPRFFRLPFGKQLSLTNRLIITGSFHYGMVRDSVDETKSVDNFDFNGNGDFEITPNIRAAFGGGYSRTMNKTKKEEDFQTYSFTSRVTIQF